MVNARPGSRILKLLKEVQSDKLIVSTQRLRASHMACNETAHALMFKVKIGSKSAIIIGHQAKNHTVANTFDESVGGLIK